MTQVWTE